MPKKQAFVDEPQHEKRHLRIVITDSNSEGEYLTVPVDTLKYVFQDKSCVLHQGDHSFILTESFINYRYAKVISFTQLFNGIQRGLLIKKEDVSEEILRKIQEGAKKSKNLRSEFRDWFDFF